MIFRPFFIPAPTFSTPPKKHFNASTITRFNIPTFFIFNFWGVPLAASGFGSGYPLLLAAYRQMVVLCLLASPASFLIFHFSFYSASRIRFYPSRISMLKRLHVIRNS